MRTSCSDVWLRRRSAASRVFWSKAFSALARPPARHSAASTTFARARTLRGAAAVCGGGDGAQQRRRRAICSPARSAGPARALALEAFSAAAEMLNARSVELGVLGRPSRRLRARHREAQQAPLRSQRKLLLKQKRGTGAVGTHSKVPLNSLEGRVWRRDKASARGRQRRQLRG